MGRHAHAALIALAVGCRAPAPLPAAPASPTGAPSALPASFPLFDGPPKGVFAAHVLNLTDAEALAAVDVAEAQWVVRLAVLRTADAGVTWAPVHETETSFGEWVAVGTEHVWMVTHLERAGMIPTLHRSSDGGRTWREIDVEATMPDHPSVVRYEALTFRDATTGALTRNGAWLRTADGGATWAPGAPPNWAPAPARPGPCRARTTGDTITIERRDGGWHTVCDLAIFEP